MSTNVFDSNIPNNTSKENNYQPSFSLQGSQPYCLSIDFMNNNWTPPGTYWEPQPNFLYRTGDNKYNHFNINNKKQHYLIYQNKYD